MERKKRKTILIIIFLTLLVLILTSIPLIVTASRKNNSIPTLDEKTMIESSQKAKEEELAYKAKWAEEHKSNSNEYIVNTYSTETDEVLENARKNSEEKNQKQIDIIKRYYSEEYEKLSKEINEYYENSFVIDLGESPLLEQEKELYDLVLKILENEKLSDEDTSLLKEYIAGKMYNIQKDTDLNTRANNILNK